MTAETKQCPMCEKPLTVRQAQQGFLCGSALCDWKFKAVPVHQRCAVCARPLAPLEVARQTCSNALCQRTWLADRPRAYLGVQRELEVARIRGIAQEFREQVASAIPDGLQGLSFATTVIPRNDAVASPLPEARRAALREHLSQKAAGALAHHEAVARGEDILWPSPPPIEPPPPAVAAVMLHACAACRGNCCRAGGEKAYISEQTILHYLETHPANSVDEIVDAYTAPLAEYTMTNGCVYQSETGCVLPRAMRSDTCNRFLCRPLIDVWNGAVENEPLSAFLVPASGDQFEHGFLVTETLVQMVRRPAQPAAERVS